MLWQLGRNAVSWVSFANQTAEQTWSCIGQSTCGQKTLLHATLIWFFWEERACNDLQQDEENEEDEVIKGKTFGHHATSKKSLKILC